MYDGRITQMQSIKSRAATLGLPFLGFLTEWQDLRYIELVDVMHNRPMFESYTYDDDSNLSTPEVAIPQVKSIPMFRTVVDSVRMSSFFGFATESVGQDAWLQAMDVFVFGFIPHRTGDVIEHLPTGPGEFDRLYHQSGAYENYLRRLVRYMQAPTPGFLQFHNGTLRRTPAYSTGNTGTFSASLSAGPAFNNAFIAEYLVAGLYQAPLAPPGTVVEACLAVTNPWVGVGAPSMSFDNVQVNPSDWGLPLSRPYTVTQYNDAGAVTGTWSILAGQPFTIVGTGPLIAPGEIWSWKFSG